MNILFLHRVWPSYGGGETVTKCLASEFIRRGHSIHVLYFKRTENKGDSVAVDKDIKEMLIPNVSFDENSSEFFVDEKEAAYVSSFTTDYINKNNIDFCINQWWPVEFHKKIRESTDAKVIKVLHMDPDTRKVLSEIQGIKGRFLRIFEPIYRIVERKKHIYSCDKYLKYSDLFVFLAPCFMDFYLTHSTFKNINNKVNYVYNPLVYKTEMTATDIQKKKKQVLVVGRLLEKHKQISRILKVWELLDEQYTREWSLKIVGDGPDRKMYEDYSKSKNLKNVFFEGYQNPITYYKEASIFLMTSAYEGWGMTILEAQQNGVVPIVMDTYKALHEILVNEKNGIITSTDLDEYRLALIGIMNDINKRYILAKNGLETCKLYSVDNVVNRWLEILSNLH